MADIRGYVMLTSGVREVLASEETGGFNIRGYGYGRFTSEGTGTGGYDIRWYRRVTSESTGG